MESVNAVGRRKAAVARVIVKEGNGQITINKRPLDVYFPSSILQYIVKQPLTTLDAAEKYDIKVNLDGGGYKGQAEALRLAIARRVYTDNHMKVIAAALKNVYDRREEITRGVEIVWEAPLMRHFTVQLKPLG